MARSKEEQAAYMREYRKRRTAAGNPCKSGAYEYDKWRDDYCVRRYGITLTQAQAMLDEQGGCCAICAKPLTLDNRDKEKSEHSAIDHCHSTGKVRGILCMHCNQGLGKFFDDPARLQAAASYLLP